ncbi:energy transducer TonB [Pedobacter montanisoli]|uniref:Energy transducer TonB n=1 Tax=Pedobacter montanisoli TaxID=2923277 RepID=A0ABS9ZVT2_9SPHI|nr:energy transducer TonB [Pedobacter montanisoli]MCJ0742415.1 energy transducer TonB [Pedobacter montanisoli]
MKNLIYIIVILCLSVTCYAQKVGDTVSILIDTINISGKVINEKGEALEGAVVISKNLNEKYQYKTAKTDRNGYFFLSGVKPIDTLIFFYGVNDQRIINNKSRYLLVKIRSKIQSYSNNSSLFISAKRQSTDSGGLLVKKVIKQPEYYFDGIYNPLPATYPGGLNKLYQLLKTNIVYPKAAIEYNVEGDVEIEFTIDTLGAVKDFLIVKDIGYGCSDEVIRILKTTKWNVAMNEGKHYPQRTSITVPFRLVE